MQLRPKQVFFPVVVLFAFASFYFVEKKSQKDNAQSIQSKEEQESMVVLMNQSWDVMKKGTAEDSLFWDELHDLTQKMRNAQLSKFHEFPVDSLQEGFDMIDSSIQKAREVSDTTAWVDGYQTVVASCVSCHETYCPGPINKINSLAK